MLSAKEYKNIQKHYPEGVKWPKADLTGERLKAICEANHIVDIHIFSNDAETIALCRNEEVAIAILDAVESSWTATVYGPDERDKLIKKLSGLA